MRLSSAGRARASSPAVEPTSRPAEESRVRRSKLSVLSLSVTVAPSAYDMWHGHGLGHGRVHVACACACARGRACAYAQAWGMRMRESRLAALAPSSRRPVRRTARVSARAAPPAALWGGRFSPLRSPSARPSRRPRRPRAARRPNPVRVRAAHGRCPRRSTPATRWDQACNPMRPGLQPYVIQALRPCALQPATLCDQACSPM